MDGYQDERSARWGVVITFAMWVAVVTLTLARGMR